MELQRRDILERLRTAEDHCLGHTEAVTLFYYQSLVKDAADEIERLRKITELKGVKEYVSAMEALFPS